MSPTEETAPGAPRARRKRQAYVTRPTETGAFPSDVITFARCRFCGVSLVPDRNRFGEPRNFCRNSHRSAWHVWRRKLAARRIENAVQTIAREVGYLHRS